MKRKLRLLKWAGGILIGCVVLAVTLNIWVVMRSNGRIFHRITDLPSAPVALVLGTSPNSFLSNRMRSVASLYLTGKVKKIIVSGDNGTTQYNEPAKMRQALISLGVPSEDIILDHAGFRTLDSVLRAKLVFGQTKIIVVSQEFHIQRAIFIALAHGIDAVGFAAPDPKSESMMSKVMLREYFARIKAWLDCYLLGTQPKFPGPPEPIQF